MANICSIKIYIPLEEVPDEGERQQLTALYRAEKRWQEAVKKNDELRRGGNRDEFLASQPGVPFKRTEWRYSAPLPFDKASDKEVEEGRAKEGELRPDSEQWNYPTVGAQFCEKSGRVRVNPYSFGRGSGLLFDESNGITVHLFKDRHQIELLPMVWSFKYSFPWWAQVGFAGAKKHCGKCYLARRRGERGRPIPYLVWEHPVAKIVENLEYAIRVYENFPVRGPARRWQWVWEERWQWVWEKLNQLNEIRRWFKQAHASCPEALAILDWGEVAWGLMSYEDVRKNDDPNRIMAGIKEMERDANKLHSGELSQDEFENKYAPTDR